MSLFVTVKVQSDARLFRGILDDLHSVDFEGGMFLISWRVVSENSAATGGRMQKKRHATGLSVMKLSSQRRYLVTQ